MSKELERTKRLFRRVSFQSLNPPPKLTVSEWADEHRRLSSEASAEAGRWRTSRAEYQREIMDAINDPYVEDIVIMASAQVGKALDVNTPIPTPEGWTNMGDLRIGDIVFDENGERCNVVSAMDVLLNRECFQINFSDGSALVADAAHRWTVDIYENSKQYEKRTVTTKEMSLDYKKGNRNKYGIPVSKPLQLAEKKLLVPAYVLGLWLGDGNSHSAQLTMHRKLDLLNVLKNKHIPVDYLRASKKQRLSLLQGLMDSDGYIDKRGRCEFTTTIPLLADGFQDLLSGLGIKHTRKKKETTYIHKGVKKYSECERFSFLVYDDLPAFRLKRKIQRMKSRKEGRPNETESRRIINIEPVKTRPVRCIAVDSPSHLFLAGKTMIPTHNSEIILNGLGYYIHYDPSPILLIQPTLDKARDFSKERVAPMIRDSPALTDRVGGMKSKDSSNTILFKSFPGGFIALGGANAPAGLAARPIRIMLADEIDRFPVSAGDEGDPLDLAEKRTTAFYNRKKIKVSTPTIKGASRIEMEFELSTQEYYNLPCPRCGEYQPLKWEQIDFETECHRCADCGYLSDEFEWKNQSGKWIATAESKMRGFHLNELLSPFRRWKEIINDFKKAKRKGTEALKVFKNTSLGETWEEEGTALDADDFVRRQETYEAEVPDGVKILTAAVDTQDDRLEIEVVGWGLERESWGIQYHVIHGDLNTQKPWDDLDKFLQSRFSKLNGTQFAIACTLIDSGGHFTQEVYKFTKTKLHRRVYAIKGESSQMSDYTPLIAGYSKPKPIEAVLVRLGVNEGKVYVMSALQVEEPGPNYCHFPKGRGYSAQYFRTLTAERLETTFVGGIPKQKWKQIRARNEGFDLRVYNAAAIEMLSPNFEKEYTAVSKAKGRRRRRRRKS